MLAAPPTAPSVHPAPAGPREAPRLGLAASWQQFALLGVGTAMVYLTLLAAT